MKKTAVIQVRVSTRRQAEKELPVESQLERCHALAERLGATVLRVFVEDGVSGYTGRRPAFEGAIAFCERTFPTYFITWSTSRFARHQELAVTSRARLERIGTELVYASFDAGADPDTRFLNIGLRELMDEYWSRQVSKDTRRSMARNAAAGYWNGGRAPVGYRPAPSATDPKRKRLEIDPAEAGLVRDIFAMRQQGLGARAIALALNEAGRLARGRPWTKSSVTSVLRSHAVKGCLVFGKRTQPHRRLVPQDQWIVVESHPAIIDPASWDAVQQMMDDATHPVAAGSPLSGFLFTGLLRCGRCGSSMQIETATGGSGKKYSYYNCRSALKHGTCCHWRLPAEDMDAFLVDTIASRVFTRRNLEQLLADMQAACGAWSQTQKERAGEITAEIRQLERKNTRILEVIESMGAGAPDPTLLLRRLNVHNARLEQLQAELAKVESAPAPEIQASGADTIAELGAFLAQTLKSREPPRRVRGFLGSVIERIILEDQQARIYYRPDLLVTSGLPFAAEARWLPEHALLRTVQVRRALPERWRRRAA